MTKNPFIKPSLQIKSRKNPIGEYAHLNTNELLDAVKKSANSPHRADLDMLLKIFLERCQARQNELDSLNKELEKRIKKEVELSKVNYKRFEQQAKMAAMGEMMDAVAHQWKQPLNALSMMSDMMRDDFKNGLITQEYVDELADDAQGQIQHMVTTLQEFRNFFRPRQTEENFGVKRSIQSVMVLVNDEFLQNNIQVDIQSDKEILLYANENEFKHLVLNIINNAKDAFNDNDISERYIYINFYEKDGYKYVDIEDTAGGVPQNIIKDIFKPEVTSKAEGKGTGIGLYMSIQIAQKMGGTLTVKNINKGACFSLKVPL